MNNCSQLPNDATFSNDNISASFDLCRIYLCRKLSCCTSENNVELKNTSFFLYFSPSDLHETAFVTVDGGLTCTSSLWLSWVIYLHTKKFT